MKDKKLKRELQSKIIAGVCSGLSTYFDIDPTLVRLLFVLLSIFGGGGIIIYAVLWIIMPSNVVLPPDFNNKDELFENAENTFETSESGVGETFSGFEQNKVKKDRKKINTGTLAGLTLISLGCFFLLEKLIPSFNFGNLWPLFLIIFGILLIISNISKHLNDKKQ